MATVSRNDAEVAASKIIEPIKVKIGEKKIELSAKMIEIYKARLPKEVLTAYMKHPDFFKSSSVVRITGAGITPQSVYLDKHLPYQNASHIDLSKEESAMLLPLINEYNNLIESKDETYDQVVNAILGFKTHKRVEVEFPEAFAVLPGVNKNTSLVISIDPLRKKVASLLK